MLLSIESLLDMEREADPKTKFATLVATYKALPFAAIETSEYSVRLELNPVSSKHCYLAIEVGVDGNVIMLVDTTGTFDNIGYDKNLLISAIDDVLAGNVTKVETSVFNIVYKSVVTLLNSGFNHTSTNVWVLPFLMLAKPRTAQMKFESYPLQ